MRNRRCRPTKVNPSPSSSRKYSDAGSRPLQVGFRILVFKVEELQHIRVFDGVIGRDGILGATHCPLTSIAALSLDKAVRS